MRDGAAEPPGSDARNLAASLAEKIDSAPIALEEPTAPAALLPLLAGDGQVRRLDEIEAEVIRFAVTHYRRRISEVARKLGIGRSTLYRKLETFGMALTAAGDASSVSVR